MKFFARLCRDHARAIVLICVLITIPVAMGVSFLEVRAGQKDLIPSRMETARTLGQVDQLFGGTTNEYPMVESDELLAYPMIKKFLLFEEAMSEALGTDDYVYIQHYLTAFAGNALAEAQKQYGPMARDISTILRLAEGTMVPDPNDPAKKIPFEQVIEDGVRQYLANPVAYKWTVGKKGSALLSEDFKFAKILIKVNPELDSPQRKDFADRAETFFHSYFEDGEVPAAVYVTGDPSIDKDLEDYVLSSSWLMAVMALGLLMLLLYLTFQRVTDIFLPLIVIVFTVIWIYGLMGWLNMPFTVVSALIGPLVLGISLGNMVHMMGRFYEEFGTGREPRLAAYKAVLTVGVAVFLACITTVFGFASFGFSDMDILRQFGYMAAAGITLCFIFCVTLLPALMSLREERRLRRGTTGRAPRGVAIFARDGNSFIDRGLARIAAISQKDPRGVVIIYVILVIVCVLGTFRLTTTPDLRALAPQDIPSLQAQYVEESVFGGIQQDVVLITGDVLRPDVQAAVLSFQNGLAQTPYFSVEGTSSVAELIRDYRLQAGEATEGTNGVPASEAEAISDLAAIGTLFGPQEGKLISEDHRAALVTVFSEGAKSNVGSGRQERMSLTLPRRRRSTASKASSTRWAG